MGCRYLIAVSLLAMVAAGCGTSSSKSIVELSARARQAQSSVVYRLYWLGHAFAGLRLTGVSHDQRSTTFVYGDCHASGESGCSPPLEIQVWSICERNALLVDVGPPATYRARAVTALDYGDDDLELATANSDVVVFANRRLARHAAAALRPFDGPRRRTLPPARYPRYYVAQLRRVRDAYARNHSLRAVHNQLAISTSAARFQLMLAHQFGTGRLRRAGQAPALDDVKRELLAATLADEPQNTDPLATSLSAQRGRTLRTNCPLEPTTSSSAHPQPPRLG